MEEPSVENGKKTGRDDKGRFVDGNPGPGRPKGSVSIVTAIKQRLKDKPEELDDIINGFFSKAKEGDVAAMKVILDRIDGPVKQEVENSGDVTIRVIRTSNQTAGTSLGAETDSE